MRRTKDNSRILRIEVEGKEVFKGLIFDNTLKLNKEGLKFLLSQLKEGNA